jgi:hypothetical protein
MPVILATWEGRDQGDRGSRLGGAKSWQDLISANKSRVWCASVIPAMQEA